MAKWQEIKCKSRQFLQWSEVSSGAPEDSISWHGLFAHEWVEQYCVQASRRYQIIQDDVNQGGLCRAPEGSI